MNHSIRMHKGISSNLAYLSAAALAVLLLLLSARTQTAHAQGSIQISVMGIPGTLPSPVISDIVRNYEQGRYPLQVIFSSPSSQAATVQFRFTLSRDGREVLSEESEPVAIEPGVHTYYTFEDPPAITFNRTLGRVMRDLEGELELQTSGALPEGMYQLTVEAEADDPFITSLQSISSFNVRYAEPPYPITPPDESVVAQPYPIFSWTPVVAQPGSQIEYDFLMVELLPGQTPRQALQANRPYAETRLVERTTFAYTPDLLALEDGRQYVWQVAARDLNELTPIRGGGRTEIQTFVYQEMDRRAFPALASIPLVPGFARLTDLDRIDSRELGGIATLGGAATLELTLDETVELPVRVQNLELQDSGSPVPVIMGGDVMALRLDASLPIGETGASVRLETLAWRFGQGFVASGSLELPGGDILPMDGDLQLTRSGLHGTLTRSGAPLLTLGEAPVELELTSVTATLPNGPVLADGQAIFFGGDTGCELTAIELLSSGAGGQLACSPDVAVDLTGDGGFVELELSTVAGPLSVDFATQSLDYDFAVDGSLELSVASGSCAAQVQLGLQPSGITLQDAQPNCAAFPGTLPLGLADLHIDDIQLNDLAYGNGPGWSFDVDLTGYLDFSFFGDAETGAMDIGLGDTGLDFPSISFDEEALSSASSFAVGEFGLKLTRLTLPSFTFPWAEFDGESGEPGPWDLSFDADVNLPDLPGMPTCLETADVQLTGGRVDGASVVGSVAATGLSDCRWDFGAGYAFVIRDIGGDLSAEFGIGEVPTTRSEVTMRAELLAGAPFDCGRGSASMGMTELRLGDPLLDGTIENLAPTCPVGVGPFQAQVTDARLVFSSAQGPQQSAELTADAELELPPNVHAQGGLSIDLITGELTDVEFEIRQPFRWDVPSDEPVLSFEIGGATISRRGLLVDGRHELALPDGTTIGATFDNLLLDLETLRIRSGEVIFDEAFAIRAGIDPQSDGIALEAVAPGSNLAMDPGLLFELAGTVRLGRGGLRSNGRADADLAFAGRTFGDDLHVVLTDSFSLGLYPFEIRKGRADFMFKNSRVAFADREGFHPDGAQFAESLIPERLPLPTEDVAYITLKNQQGDLLVDATDNGDGTITLATIGQPLSLVVPMLDANSPPTVANVSLNGVTINADPTNPDLVSGSITADVPDDEPTLDPRTYGIPMSLDRLVYEIRSVDSSDLTALFLEGDLLLFEEQITDNGNVALYVQSGGQLQGQIDIQNLSRDIELVPGSERVVYNVNRLNGAISVPMLGSQAPVFDFLVDGHFEVRSGGQPAAQAVLNLRVTEGGMNVREFSGSALSSPPDVQVGDFFLSFDDIPQLPAFSYSSGQGFDFAAKLDVSLGVDLADGTNYAVPLTGIEVSESGLEIPSQDIHEGNGLVAPSFSLGGGTLTPLAMRTGGSVVFDWYDGTAQFNLAPEFDFELRLPEYDDTGLVPQDGLTFTGVTLDDGYLVGTLQPYSPPGGALVPLGPVSSDPPTLNITQVGGSLSKVVDGQTTRQGFDLDVDGEIASIDLFTTDNPQSCAAPATFSLTIVDGVGFDGTVNSISPCGAMAFGPISLAMASSTLTLSYTNDTQQALLDGTATVSLPATAGPPVTATGSLGLDLMNGSLTTGFVEIDDPFAFSVPVDANDPLLTFTVNQARLDQSGFQLQGQGDLQVGNETVSVSFNNLRFRLEDGLPMEDGSASIDAGFQAFVGLQPLGLELMPSTATPPSDDGILVDFSSNVTLNSDGLGFSGSGSADLQFANETYQGLQVLFASGFTLSTSGFSVGQGRADFFLAGADTDVDDPLAYIDQSGFNMGQAIVAALPERLGLPTEDIAYITVKDQDGDPLVDVTENGQGGWTFATQQGQPLTLVLASLDEGISGPPEVQVDFSLVTDDSYTPTGGSITAQSPTDLEPFTGLPLELESLSVETNTGFQLAASVRVELPPSLGDEEVLADVRFDSDGFLDATAELGTYTPTFDPMVPAAYTHSFSGTLPGAGESDAFDVNLMGVRLQLGGQNGIDLSGTVTSTLLTKAADEELPIFFAGSFGQQGWTFNVDASSLGQAAELGAATLTPEQHQPVSLNVTDTEFILALSGTVAFQDFAEVTVEGLEIGVRNVTTSPEPVFDMGGATASLPNQQFNLLEGNLVVGVQDLALTIDGRALAASMDGDFTFLEETVAFTDFEVDTEGAFSIGSVSASDVQLLDEYVTLTSMALGENQYGLELTAETEVTLPEPVSQTATATITVGANNGGGVDFDVDTPTFSLDQTYDLGGFAEFTLTDVAVDINPSDILDSGLYANGTVDIAGDASKRIELGDPGNVLGNPGIAYSPLMGLAYNVTGNLPFSFDSGFFTIDIGVNVAGSGLDEFLITLDGDAGVNIQGVTGSLGYEGFQISTGGVESWGNLDGSGTLTLMSFASLKLGTFERVSDENGVDIEIPAGSDADPQELQSRAGDAAPTQTVTVTEYLCFGPCDGSDPDPEGSAIRLDLGGDSSPIGGFAGGVGQVLFYREMDGTQRLKIDNAFLQLDNTFEMTASLDYISAQEGMMLRASGAGSFKTGNTTVEAAVAGKFANMDNELSFGVFAAVKTSAGIPLFPGVIDVTGLGGGFFYRPVQEDIDAVTGAVTSGFGYEFYDQGAMPSATDVDFALMAYAAIGVAGGSGAGYIFEGETYFQLTEQSVFLDAQGIIMELDGSSESVAGTKLEGGMFLSVTRDPFFINAGAGGELDVPEVLNGTVDATFFAGNYNDEYIWGITGAYDYDIFGGYLGGGGELLACDKGILVTASITAGLGDIPIISLQGAIEGSVWLLDPDTFSMPFGAYATLSGEACAGICATVSASAAFVTTGSDYELFAAGKGCVDLLVDEGCVSAWVSVASNGFDGGFGSGDHANLIDDAKAQRDEFADYIDDMRNKIQDASDALNQPAEITDPEISAEDIAQAGANLHLMDDYDRNTRGSNARSNEFSLMQDIPSGIDWVYDNVWTEYDRGTLPDYQAYNPDLALDDAEQIISVTENMAGQVAPRVVQTVPRAIRWQSQAETTFDNLVVTLDSSPISNVQSYEPGPDAQPTQSPSFDIDEAKASQQAQSAAALRDELEALDEEFRDAIASVEENINKIDSLLGPVQVTQQADGKKAAYSPSVNTLAGLYQFSIESVDRYYSLRATEMWDMRDWAVETLSQLQSRESSIDAAITQIVSASSDRSSNAMYASRERVEILMNLADENPRNTSHPDAADHHNYLNSAGTSDYRSSIRTRAKALWYEMHVEGLTALRDAIEDKIQNEVATAHETALDPLKAAHRDLTETLDDLYLLKADMHSTLYGMLDHYITWRESRESLDDNLGLPDGDPLAGLNDGLQGPDAPDMQAPADDGLTPLADYEQKRSEVAGALEPPVLSSVQVYPQRAFYFNQTEVKWYASHPQGIIESSIHVRPGTTTNLAIGLDQYRSVGGETSVDVYGYKEAENEQSKSYSVGVRARGTGGNTSIQRVTFDMSVDEGGSSSSYGTSVLEDDNSAPPRPFVGYSQFYERHPQSTGQGSVQRYWTDDPGRIRFTILGFDLDSDITSFEYAIGTTEGGTDVVDWTEGQGSRERVLGGVRMSIDRRGVNLSVGQPYYVSARVTNGAGLTSNVRNGSSGLVYDETPPGQPDREYVALYQPIFFSGGSPTADPLVDSPPSVPTNQIFDLLGDYRDALENVSPPTVSASWTAASDAESGILNYDFVGHASENLPEGLFMSEGVTTEDREASFSASDRKPYYPTYQLSSQQGAPFVARFDEGIVHSYLDSGFVSVRARNKAGATGEPLTFGPLRPADSSAPSTPVMRAMETVDEIRLYLKRPSFDPQTDLKGYQYALGSEPGTYDIRPYPNAGIVDFDRSNFDSFIGIFAVGFSQDDLPVLVIDKNDLPTETFYVHLRALNTRNKTSGTDIAGPILLDDTQPEAPSISLQLDGNQNELTIEADNLHDPESGIVEVEYRVQNTNTYDPYPTWYQFVGINGVRTSALSHSKTVTPPSYSLPSKLKVYIRVTNAAGLTRTTSKQVTNVDLQDLQRQNYQPLYGGF